jgi:uncharacterized protein
MNSKVLSLALLCSALAMAVAPAAVQAQATTPPASSTNATPAGASAASKELVQRLLAQQRQGVERMALQMVEQPALQMMQGAAAAVQRVPAERREALARELQSDARKYVEDTYPAVRDRAVALMGSTLAPMLEERLTEDELREVLRILESPAHRKYQALAPELAQAMQRALVEQTRASVEPKVAALEQTMRRRIEPAAGPSGGPAGSAPAAAASRPAAKK